MLRTTALVFLTLTMGGWSSIVAATPAERLAQALRYKTISYQESDRVQPAEFVALNRHLKESFPRVFDELAVESVNTHSLLIHWPGSDSTLKPVLFTAHTDVVPIEPGTESGWTHPPFSGVISDGRIYGRGTLDDKQGVLGLLEAAESLLLEGYTPRRGLVFAFGHDEEISGPRGAAILAQRMVEKGLSFQWMVDEGGLLITDNPMLPDRPLAMINIAEKAYVTLTLVATGEGGHSSRPPKISTIGRLAAALQRIESNPYPVRLSVPVQSMLEALAPHVGQPQRFIFNNLWLTESIVAQQMGGDPLTDAFVRSTTALTMFNAGVKENVVPQRAEAKVNFRLLPGDTPQELLSRIEALVDDPLITISAKDWNAVIPIADPAATGFQVISQAVSAVYPEAVVVPSLLTATTDTRHYVDLAENHYRFHGVLMDASQANSIHGTDEYISVESYEKSIEVARQMLMLGSR